MGQAEENLKLSGATLGAHTSVLRIESLAFLPGFGFGTACAALVGQYLGAKKPAEAQRAAVLCNRLALLTMTLSALPMVIPPVSRVLLGWMVDSPRVVELAVIPLILAGLRSRSSAVAIIKSSALRGAGDTVSPMISTMTGMAGRVILVLGIMAYLMKTGHAQWGLTVVWVAILLDLAYRGVFMEIIFRRGKWKEKKV